MTPTYKADLNSDLMLFAISMFAWKPYSAVEHRAIVTVGGTRREARNAGLKEARKLWPKSDGWQEHHVQVQPFRFQFKITDHMVEIATEETIREFVM